MNRLTEIFTALLIPLFLTGWFENARSQEKLIPLEESKIWIEGRSNVNSFICQAGSFDGEALYRTRDFSMERGPLSVQLTIPVQRLDCGRSRMNRDLYEALKSDEFEFIHFEYRDATITSGGGTLETPYLLEVRGQLWVAGVERSVRFEAEGTLMDTGVVRIRGEKKIRMTDYEVDPPVGLLGLVRAQDELTVHFDIQADGMNTIQLVNDN